MLNKEKNCKVEHHIILYGVVLPPKRGHVFTSICWLVCLSVSRISKQQKKTCWKEINKTCWEDYILGAALAEGPCLEMCITFVRVVRQGVIPHLCSFFSE